MQRKQFLRHAAIAVPAAILAPQLLMAGDKTATTVTSAAAPLLIINGNMATANHAISHGKAVSIEARKMTQVLFSKGQWHVHTSDGKQYTTAKLVINGLDSSIEEHNVLRLHKSGQPVELCFGLAKNRKAAGSDKYPAPQVWMQESALLDKQLFTNFMKKEKPVLLCCAAAR